jgi:hypothetical protein
MSCLACAEGLAALAPAWPGASGLAAMAAADTPKSAAMINDDTCCDLMIDSSKKCEPARHIANMTGCQC